MKVHVAQKFFFDAAHTLKREIEAEGSARIHGHTYHAEVALCGVPDPATGMVVDLGILRREVAAVRERLDHHFLDQVPGLAIPTLENLCAFILDALRPSALPVTRVSVWRDAVGDRADLYTDDN